MFSSLLGSGDTNIGLVAQYDRLKIKIVTDEVESLVHAVIGSCIILISLRFCQWFLQYALCNLGS